VGDTLKNAVRLTFSKGAQMKDPRSSSTRAWIATPFVPSRRYEFATWKTATVNIDYHVEVDRHYYSSPTSSSDNAATSA
jgi:hypothetical protein